MRQFAVIGLGYLGSTVALELHARHHEVLGVDSSEIRVNGVSEQLTHAVIADPVDRSALEELALKNFDAVLIDLDTLEASMMCTLHAQELEAREIWVRALSDEHCRLLERLGVTHIVHPDHDTGLRIAQSLSYRFVIDFIHLGEEQYVIEMAATEAMLEQYPDTGSLLAGGDATLLAIRRGDGIITHPRPRHRPRTGRSPGHAGQTRVAATAERPCLRRAAEDDRTRSAAQTGPAHLTRSDHSPETAGNPADRLYPAGPAGHAAARMAQPGHPGRTATLG
ncbi:potassium channel family protein [Kushneria sinocarnis]|uniref:potassium channel family protein n=1 Tax=Kushneria sinocarnis TaxID=595502 RepID=UPI000EADC666|nr:TrkA family potassium uptake protein [Kushneria sinocarnis]